MHALHHGQRVKPSFQSENEQYVAIMDGIITLAFQLECNNIQMMFENSRISREATKQMRANLSLLEIELKKNEG
jgi:hypothetical protein